ncbi:(2Fe-2S)-binding protein [Spiractinospora alimapuensis]|uniref:(2Fe-2S)-binding protein n=1 Tax=Spiractinospora alimapuensis TaxID=2820884 RepID=UPI001F16EA5B|nr:(2Fe-2S)-binding protein [Spiractinospora alimapuensis]QVQ52489.1 (2Fe-2S)-binding protein [Spiractinospora alimapuensis]
MTCARHPLSAIVDACASLRFAPLPSLRVDGLAHGTEEHPELWLRADRLGSADALGPVYDKVTAEHGPGHRLPAVVRFQRALLRDPVFLVAAGIYLAGRAPLLRAEDLWYPWHADASIGTPVVTSTRVAVLPDDPAAGHPDVTVVSDERELDRVAARSLVETVRPMLGALQQHTRMGTRTLWGWVADSLCFYMLNPARFLGHDSELAWARGQAVVDEMVTAGAVLRDRPQLFPFCANHPGGVWAVRGTCCFDYKADAKEDYCLTCPLRDDASRTEKLLTWLNDPATAP